MTIVGPSGRSYDPLPIDNSGGFPQSFPLSLNGVSYQFLLYVNASESSLGEMTEPMVLPDANRFLVVRADLIGSDGTTQTIFLRKVTPSQEYQAGQIGLFFPTQTVVRQNLNQTGAFGSNVIGGVASL
jgi:hypothetical protein